MGVNLHQIGGMLGINSPTANPNYGQPTNVPVPGMTPNALLGPQAVDPDQAYSAPAQPAPSPYDAVAPAEDEIVATGAPVAAPAAPAPMPAPVAQPPQMTPDSMGMPSLPATQPMDPESIADLRQRMRDKAELARQLYHPKSEFGTHGVLRDIIGNVSDMGRRLLGFSPRYNEEKWSERAYGMTSSDPKVAAASTEQAMQYSSDRTMPYEKHIAAIQNARASTAANAAYKDSQVDARVANIVSGLGSSLLSANLGAPPDAAQANYERMLPAIQANLDKLYGPGVMKAPETYSDSFARQIAQSGYTGTNVQRAQATVLNAQNQQVLQQMRGDIQLKVQGLRGENQIQVARILADSRMSIAEKEAVIRMLPVSEEETRTESGSIIRPTVTTTTTKGYAPGGQSDRKYYNGKWYTRGPNGEAVEVQ